MGLGRIAAVVGGALCIACVPHLEPMEPIETDRPDKTESATLVPAGMVQVEGGATTERSGAVHSVTIGELLVRVGVHPMLEVRIEPLTHTRVSSGGVPPVGGFEDLAVGVKTPLLRIAKKAQFIPDVSLLLATSLPTGHRAFRADAAEPEAVLAAHWGLSEALGFGANMTARRGAEDDQRYWERGASATLGLSVSDRLGSYVEWYGTRDERDPSATHVVNGGLTYKLSSDFQLDARAGRGTNQNGGFLGLAQRW